MPNYVTMRRLGSLGRAGNQMFQYAYLTIYSQRYDCELQLPPWVGNKLFGLSNPPITVELPAWREDKQYAQGSAYDGQPMPPQGTELVNHDFQGFAQYHTALYAQYKDQVRGMFSPTEETEARLLVPLTKLLASGDTTVGVHIRRGDYGLTHFPIIPISWYVEWLGSNWSRLGDPSLFIASEDPELVQAFSEYNPQTVSTLGVQFTGEMEGYNYLPYERKQGGLAVDWYPDFYLLSHCDVVVAPSSTFSFMAAMLNPNLKEYWRASLKAEGFVQENPWNAYPLLREKVRDFPHLEGIAKKNNPYWGR